MGTHHRMKVAGPSSYQHYYEEEGGKLPATMAGSRGGTIGAAANPEWVGFANRLLSGEMTFREISDQLMAQARPKTVTLVVNNACNLACAHCYLQVEKLTTRALREEEWREVIDSVAATDPELVCLSGKEVFLGERGVRLLTYLGEGRARLGSSYRVGIITNGTRIGRFRDAILAARPSYFDISLDGLEDEHDSVRGHGAFAQAWPNILWAAEAFGDAFFVNVTLQQRNFRGITQTVRYLNEHGIRNVGLGFYIPLPYTAPGLALSPEDLDAILDGLGELGTIDLRGPLTVHFDLDVVGMPALLAFLRSDWFSMDRIQEDVNGELFVEHGLPNGALLKMRLAPFPTGISRSLRITPEGNYLAAEDTVDTTGYAVRRLGNIREFNFDFGRLHVHARSSLRFVELIRDYCVELLPLIVAAAAKNTSGSGSLVRYVTAA
jgi:hypothetical protein